MKSQIVTPRSHLIGKRCQVGCRNKVEAGQAVLVKKLDPYILGVGCDPWFVMHVDCVSAKCDAAPEGLHPRNAAANIAIWRRELVAAGAIPVRS